MPDHTIFDHLDLVTALATCLHADPEGGPAHLVVSLGPVQGFIAAARSTSDLWAGSHLLSRIAWEAMRVVCERLGPQAILFPRLRGVPQVDLWLREEQGLRDDLFAGEAWVRRQSDANPLFAAALPNRFSALVPSAQAREIAEAVTKRVRDWAREQAEKAYRELLEVAGIDDRADLPGYEQIRRQLADFPEVQWAAVPWSLADTDRKGRVQGTGRLARAMAPFFESDPPGFLGSPVWQIMKQVLGREREDFWTPNPGMLYPAWFDLAERSLAAVKALRPFHPRREEGWRDTLDGEAEWLTTDRDHLGQYNPEDGLWARVAQERKSWARPKERLSAPNALKRLWPNLFLQELEGVLQDRPRRFVVSTHTMAVARLLADAVEHGREIPPRLRQKLEDFGEAPAALPRKLAERLREHPDRQLIARIPAWLDALALAEDEEEDEDTTRLHEGENLLKDYLGESPEGYYALLLMDGDRMGAWLAADPEVTGKEHRDSFHPRVRRGVEEAGGEELRAYAQAPRAATPAWHMAISEALNHFALRLAPAAVEEHYGRILYAGGDDLMAMLPVADLPGAMAAVRAAYSGIGPKDTGLPEGPDSGRLEAPYTRQANGFVLHHDRLLRLMGENATASCGAVVAHHKAPLGAVLRELRAAEARAKEQGGRNAFSISVVKRSGGALYLTARWGEPLALLLRLRNFLAEPATSRRAVYHVLRWLPDMPEPGDEESRKMLAELLAYQFRRQCASKATRKTCDLSDLAKDLVDQAVAHRASGEARKRCRDAPPSTALRWLENFLSVAEFLARQGRVGQAAAARAGDAAEEARA